MSQDYLNGVPNMVPTSGRYSENFLVNKFAQEIYELKNSHLWNKEKRADSVMSLAITISEDFYYKVMDRVANWEENGA